MKVNGKELAANWIGRVAFLKPFVGLCTQGFQIASIKGMADGVNVTLNYRNHRGFSITINWNFQADIINEQVKITNIKDIEFTVLMRFHNMLKSLSPGCNITYGQKTFHIEPNYMMFVNTTDSENIGERLNAKPEPLATHAVKLSHPQYGEMEFELGENLYGSYWWNSLGASNGSFEPIFGSWKLKPQSSLSYTQIIKIFASGQAIPAASSGVLSHE